MSNLTKGNKIGSSGSSLHARIASKKMLDEIAPRPDPTSMPNRIGVICDFSGSMDESGGTTSYNSMKTKLDLLKEGVQDFALRADTNTTSIAVESFPRGLRIALTTDSQEVYTRMIGARTLGSTPMGEGMFATLEHHSPTRCLLISDGDNTDANQPFEAAEVMKNKEIVCDTIHIGNSSGGEETLKRIASITGGMFLKFKDVTSFSANLHHLLPGAREAIAGMLPYEAAKLLGANEVK